MSLVRPELKYLHSPDVDDLESFVPDSPDNFSFLLQAVFGSTTTKGEESFDLIVCTPKWLEQQLGKSGIAFGRHHLIVCEYSIQRIRAFLLEYAETCVGATWHEVATKLARIGQWEFEDYKA